METIFRFGFSLPWSQDRYSRRLIAIFHSIPGTDLLQSVFPDELHSPEK